MNFSYDLIETQIVEALPELRPAAEVYAKKEGKPGEDSRAYIFFESMFATYVEVLLAMPNSPARDRLLSRAFNLVEDMIKSPDLLVSDLAYIGVFESKAPWFYSCAVQFVGPVSRRELEQHEPAWPQAIEKKLKPEVGGIEEIIDLFCVREVILSELQCEGIRRERIPGITYPQQLKDFPSLTAARTSNEAVVFLSYLGTTFPCVVCPPTQVACTETALWELTQDLADIDNQEPNQGSKAQVMFLRIPRGERVWNMNHNDKKHLRYHGEFWIADKFSRLDLSKPIREILSGKWPTLRNKPDK